MDTKTDEKVLIGVWVEPEIVQQLEARAQEADRSRSGELRQAIREHLARVHHETEEATA
jgi:predicted transcriptional regulator